MNVYANLNDTKFNSNLAHTYFPLIAFCLALLVTACQNSESDTVLDSYTVEITAVHDMETNEHLFELARDTVAAGWTTFELINASPDEHLLQLLKFGDEIDITAEKFIEEVTLNVQESLYLLHDPDVGPDKLSDYVDYPDWIGQWTRMGGPAIVSPGLTAEATVDLEPGTYIIECYIKDEDQMMHSSLGMIALLEVTESTEQRAEPEADMEITVSEEGFQIHDQPEIGTNRVKVNFEERETPGYRNVNLVRLDKETDLGELSFWMNGYNWGGLVSPSLFRFKGGIAAMAPGHTGYFTIDLEPGEYAWVSEYLDTSLSELDLEEMGWLKRFEVE